MTASAMLTVATFALAGGCDVRENLDRHLDAVRRATEQGAQLIVFPEASLHGYPTAVHGERRMLSDVYASAEPLDGPHARALVDAARQRGVHVVFGMTERGPGAAELYNTAVLAGPDGVIGAHRKVHLGLHEQVVWRRGSEWGVFNTPFGRLGLLICYDQAWPESCRELVLGGADLLVMPAAWSHVEDPDDPGRLSEEQYLLYGRARAVDNVRWFVSSNYAGAHGGATFFGHSQVIDPNGRVVAETAPDRDMALVEIDVRGGIEAACARGIPPGERVGRDRRPDTYRRLRASMLADDRP